MSRDRTLCCATIALVAVFACAAAAPAAEPTVRRPPTYWACQGNFRGRLIATFLETDPPSAILEREGKRIVAAQRKSASGTKYMASDGAMFWIKGKSALLEWPAGMPSNCVSLD